jgi:hypothetical protein
VATSCDHCTEPLDSATDDESLDNASKCQLPQSSEKTGWCRGGDLNMNSEGSRF